MRDHTAQRPVYLVNVAQGNRVADREAFVRSCALLRSEEIPFKVLESRNYLPGDPEVIVLSEEYVDTAFALALANNQSNVTYLAFDRVAYVQTSQEEDCATGGAILGEFKAVGPEYQGARYFDNNRNQAYAII